MEAISLKTGEHLPFPTKNSLSEKSRVMICALLQDRLSESIDLFSQVKHAHWNVKGPNFIALHQLFDEVAEAFEGYSDLIAERIAQLGGKAEGTLRMAARRTKLEEYPITAISGREHVEAMGRSLAAYGESIQEAIHRAEELADRGTADLLTEVSRGADKWLWFIESHNQSGQ